MTPNFNQSPRQVEQFVKENGTVKGIFKCLGYSAIAITVPLVGYGIYITWKSSCDKKTKLATQNNKSSNNIKEQNNASSNRQREQDHASQNKINEIKAQSEADLAKIKAANEAKLSEINHREDRRAARTQKMQLITQQDTVESYAEAQANGHLTGEGEKCLGFPYFKVGYSRAFVGTANVGKTTYILQEAIAIASGYCNVPLTANWVPIPRVVGLSFIRLNNLNLTHLNPCIDCL